MRAAQKITHTNMCIELNECVLESCLSVLCVSQGLDGLGGPKGENGEAGQQVHQVTLTVESFLNTYRMQ